MITGITMVDNYTGVCYLRLMLRTANDLYIGATIRLDEETIGIVDYLEVDEDGVWIEGYEESSGDEFNRVFDYDDEVDIIYTKG